VPVSDSPPPADERILRDLEEIVRTHLDRDVELRRDVRLTEALELDSIRRLTLVIEIENRYRIFLDDGDEPSIETVGDLVDVIRTRLP